MFLSTVMMGLGLFRFGVDNAVYQSLKRDASFRWSHVDRVGRAPAAQFLGPGVKTINLQGVIYPHYSGGLRQVEAMELAAGLGQPMMLVDGLGFVFDRWCITSVSQTKTVFLAGGAPRRIDFAMTLESYGGGFP
ncbi:MAG: phage tail protein [Pseudomonadota bacterium]